MIEVRKATTAELADIIRIGREVFSATFGHSVPHSDLEAYLESAYTEPLITEELRDDSKDIIVAVHHDNQHATMRHRSNSHFDSSIGTSKSSDSREEGKVVGFAQLTRGSSSGEPCLASLDHVASTAELQRLFVDLSYHGKGIGSRLARTIEDIARRDGFTHMWLGVWEENTVAKQVYEKLGYTALGFHDFVVGSIVQRDHILMKAL
ncbi:hypothetical protein NQ176_g3126 [Zarea fungicola]|uniref:Uncharacterized protein n=1 Tax=Zarea fungicola TaxID=93591 RepID=A0ACC1NLA3_9HYPO|nr:hypothetical protein NQ176_g3126 [Lecanicillium fungicola]